MTFQKRFLLLILASIALCHAGHGRSFCSGPIVDLASGRAESVTITRWGNASQQTTVVTFSFVRSAYMENAAAEGANGVQVEPILNVNHVGVFPFPANSRELVRTAFQLWAAVANISFAEVEEDDDVGMIRIGTHALSAASGELGHAFFPGSSAVAGDIHFAKNYPWTAGEFFATAVHEIGHSIGLHHIVGAGDVSNAIMYEIIPVTVTMLTSFDIAYAQCLYEVPVPRIGLADITDPADVVSWSYPCDHGIDGLTESCTLQPTARYAADITQNVDLTAAIANVQRHDLVGFELQTSILSDPAGAPTVLSGAIPATARSIKLAELADGDYLVELRAKFVDGSVSNFGVGNKRVENQAAIVIDVVAPVAGVFQAGAAIDIDVVFDEIVAVTGNPRLELLVGNGIRAASFLSGSNTNQLRFRYVVAVSDEECQLQYLNQASLQRDGGDIVDFFDAPANLDLPRPGTANALDTKPAITLDNAGPTVETARVAGNNEYVEIRFSEGVYGNLAATIPVGLDDFAAFLGQEPLILEELVDVNDSVLHGGESTLRLRFSAPPIQTPAQIITIRLVADIFDCAGHALTANPDQPLAMIALNQPVAFTLRWIVDGSTPEETLVVGRDPAGVDATAHPEAHIYSLAADSVSLAADYRPLEEFSYWTIVAQAPGDMDTATLRWEITQARPDYRLFLQEWDESRPIGAPIDLRIIDSIVVRRTTTYQLMYGPAQTMEIPPLQPGWNLICIPLHYQEAVESVFGGRVSSTMWTWRGDRFLAVDINQPTNPGDGYWFFSASGCPPLTFSGLPGVQMAPIESGWNLIGRSSAMPLPESIAIWQWDEINQQLERVSGADSLTRGYWWFAR